MKTGTKIVIGLVAVGILAGLAMVAVEAFDLQRDTGASALSPHVSGYAALAEGATPAPKEEVLRAVKQGRLIAPVDVTGDDIHLDVGVYDAMPEAERPLEDEAVTAVALLRYWEDEEKGFVNEYCQVTIIDRATGHIIATETIAGYTGGVRVNPERGELKPSKVAEYLLSPSLWQMKGLDLEPPAD